MGGVNENKSNFPENQITYPNKQKFTLLWRLKVCRLVRAIKGSGGLTKKKFDPIFYKTY